MKKVELEGVKYKITFVEYGFDNHRILVNNNPSSIIIDDNKINDVRMFSDLAKKAIVEYLYRKQAEQIFKKWDGKL